MDQFLPVLNAINGIVWGPFVLIPLLLGTGIYLTVRFGGLQLIRLGAALRLGLLLRKDDHAEGDISQFQALTTALAATVGVGNIVGVAGAISLGGPGAVFWMWITGFVGMATKYAEAFLGVRFRRTDAAGEKTGGPQYYLQLGIRGPLGTILAVSFAFMAMLASFGAGNMAQANAISTNLESSAGIPVFVTGLILAGLALIVLIGGVRSIGRVTAGLVPVMIVAYVGAALYILLVNIGEVPGAFAQIFVGAFTGSGANQEAIAGGLWGAAVMYAIQFGVARGIFSNESGLGSAGIAAAAAQTTHPVRQGLVSMTQTFIDTIIVVTLTALVLISTEAWTSRMPGTMTGEAFSTGLPGEGGHWIVTIALVLFAFSTMLGWAYYGERNVERLFGRRLVMPYRMVYVGFILIGATIQLDVVWSFSDLMNGLRACLRWF